MLVHPGLVALCDTLVGVRDFLEYKADICVDQCDTYDHSGTRTDLRGHVLVKVTHTTIVTRTDLRGHVLVKVTHTTIVARVLI